MTYNILPTPKKTEYKDGVFKLCGCTVYIDSGLDSRISAAALKLKNKLTKKTGNIHLLKYSSKCPTGGVFITKDASLAEEGYILKVDPDGITVTGGDDKGCFYGIVTLLQILDEAHDEISALYIEDAPDMGYRGFYHDATRGRVPSVEGMKRLVDRLVKYKINSLQIYVEHTFDFNEFKTDIRTDNDYLTAEDIIEIDRYCYDNFIDFIPSLSTFGHLYELLTKKEYKHLCELENFEDKSHFWLERMAHHTIDPSNPESIEVIYSLIDQYLPLFRSQYFNICCDETFDLCRGRNQGKDKADLYITFVSKIISHVTAAGKTVMMWGDIALEHPELLDRIPEGTVLLNWEYGAFPNIGKIEKVRETGISQIVCPGTNSWTSLIEKIDVSVPNILKMAKGAYDNGALGVLNTNWGDYGHPSHPECTFYGMLLGACASWNIATAADEAFEMAASRSVYGADINIVPMIAKLGKAHDTAPWIQCFWWRWQRDAGRFASSEQDIIASIESCEEIITVLSDIDDTQNTLTSVINAAKGILLLNRAALLIKKNGAVDDEWRRQANIWFKEYEKCWLLYAKPSEVSEIGRFIDNF